MSYMKLNYYTYLVKFKSSGVTCKICVKDIVDLYCAYQKKQSVLEKSHSATSRKLYFAKASLYNSIYYLMTPTDLQNYRSLDRSSGYIKDLKSIVGSASLEKVTFVHLDDHNPIIGIASSHGGATDEDVEYYLNQIINGLLKVTNYTLELKPIDSGVARSDIKNIKMLSEAKVLMRSTSSQFSKLDSFLNASSNSSDIEIEIRIKRNKNSRVDIKNHISPLLDIIKNDPNDIDFADVFLRGKARSAQETIKDILLDKTMVLFDIINPRSATPIETQVENKRYANGQVDLIADAEFKKYGTKLKTNPPCSHWIKLKDPTSY
jgi:hypothetical protein